MERLNRQWYDDIVEDILAIQSNVAFIVDPLNLLLYEGIISKISTKFTSIQKYSNQLQLRRILKTRPNQTIILFHDELDIPFDLSSIYSVSCIKIDKIFPFLDPVSVSELAIEQYQPLFEYYTENIENKKYERLSRTETQVIIKEVVGSEDRQRRSRATHIVNQLIEMLSEPISGEWINKSGELANLWGELQYLNNGYDLGISLADLKSRINSQLVEGIQRYYDDTAYDSTLPMQWNILKNIENDGGSRNAILCFDCLGFEEWHVLKEFLQAQTGFRIIEKFSFAVLPTETNHSRTSLFAGLPPKKIMESKKTEKIETRFEEDLFKAALSEYGIDGSEVFYQRCTGPDDLTIDFSLLHDYKRLGFIFTFIDTLTHNKMMNKKKLGREIKEYLIGSEITQLLHELISQGFNVYICSDHGSISAKGNGIRPKTDLVDERARRYVLCAHEELAKEFVSEKSMIIQLKNILGEHKWLVLLREGEMFSNLGDESLTHGGISIDEVVIPFVKVVSK